MKKIVIIILVIILLIIFCICSYLFISRKIEIGQSSLKEIFNSTNINEVEIWFTNVLGEEKEKIESKQDIENFIGKLKQEEIKPIIKKDKVNIGDSYRIKIKYKNKDYKIVISNNTMTINSRLYQTGNNLVEKLSDIFIKYSDYYQ